MMTIKAWIREQRYFDNAPAYKFTDPRIVRAFARRRAWKKIKEIVPQVGIIAADTVGIGIMLLCIIIIGAMMAG